jgi:transcriptional regulator with XRE-family HTH domain
LEFGDFRFSWYNGRVMDGRMAVWFRTQIEDRGWSLREMARRVDVSHTTIVNLVNGRSRPSVELCKRVAHTFGVSHLEVMRLAGLLDPAPPDTARLEEVKQLFTELTREEQDIVLAQIRALVERKQRTPQAEQRTPQAEQRPQPVG